MAIQDYKVSEAYSGRDISSLSDRPNQDGMSASQLKARFDQLNKEVIPNYNDLIDLLDTYIQTNDGDIVALENAINGLGISLGDLDLSVQEVLDAYNSGVLSGVYTGTTEPTDPRIKVWIDPDGQGIVIDETNRVNQEIVRQSNEGTRVTNENTRISNENTRISQESSRVSAENTRVTQENARNVFVAYNPLTPYVVGNKVSYNGSSYVCILDSLGNLPTNSTYWLLIAQKGEQGIQGDNTTADAVTNTPSGNISSTTVQGAINELDTEKADRLFATNLVTNGDFSNGTTGWSLSEGVTVTGGRLKFLSNAGVDAYAYPTPAPFTVIGRKYYVKADMEIISGELLIDNNVSYKFNKNGFNSVVITATQTLLLFDDSTALATDLYADNIMVLDLTSIFGAGKEPTKEQMDWLLAQKYANSWFDGTKELCSITDLLTLVNTKANITQEAWITPTLLNGWTAIGGVDLRYRKNQFGRVELKGWVGTGTLGVAMFNLPVGYRPLQSKRFAVGTSGASGVLRINNDGNVLLEVGSVASCSIDSVSFYVD